MQKDNNLRAIRRERGLAALGLAVMANVGPSWISAIEKWRYYPSNAVRERIARTLNVPEQDIWPEREGPSRSGRSAV